METILPQIDHLIVLMMENRSSDHVLGALTLEEGRTDVDGLTPGLANAYEGVTYPVHHRPATALQPDQDPPHDGAAVAEQLADGHGGFVRSYARAHPGDPDRGLVMGYYTGADLPVSGHLAREFGLCDRWFCAVPGATGPNRLYAAARHRHLDRYATPRTRRRLGAGVDKDRENPHRDEESTLEASPASS